MAVGAARETWRGRALSYDKRGLSWTRVFLVNTTLPTDTDILSAAGLPAIDDAFPGKPGTSAKNYRVKDRGSPLAWEVVVEYGPTDETNEGGESGDDANDPTDNPVKIKGGSEFFMLAVTRTIDTDAPIVNSAGVAFDTPVEIEVGRPFLLLEKNENAAPYAKARQFTGKVNSTTFYGAPKNTLMCQDITFNNDWWTNPDTGARTEYWVVQYKFLYKEDEWNDLKVLDVGYQQKIDGEPVNIRLKDGSVTSRPLALNADGTWRKTGQVRLKHFKVYPEADFSGLDL